MSSGIELNKYIGEIKPHGAGGCFPTSMKRVGSFVATFHGLIKLASVGVVKICRLGKLHAFEITDFLPKLTFDKLF